ncbi:putative PAP-specific phosphatase, mitochondrial [Macadamia integrifolia]|uniref:putative PAP-specific phosphatase, mitochondrial n=1 Tax=Macadamia integrifolia TaxID=60698 RepID=UPI001C4EB92C|nr:putative PAP-specific phosphatase, mitochondrial [Macadamia integrifolia]XP_042492889.1 putative PAP-specific phosphatase, mitochondrial [Macadamia integrifolia]
MDLLRFSSPRFSTGELFNPRCSSTSRCHSHRFFTLRSSLPFPPENAKYHRELEAAVNVVEKSCRICVDVQKSLFGSSGRILEKIDQTPVTVADFGVQALISLELGRMFPSIPLVAEEDSSFLRSTPLSQAVVSAVIDKASLGDESLSESVVLEAIDRGGKDAFAFGTKPATYWLLDPIDGTKGFLKGGEALYVVGLALVVEGEIVLGVMGCPNWEGEFSKQLTAKGCADRTILSGSGIIMVAHIGCGTWTKRLSDMLGGGADVHNDWVRCFVDKCRLVHEARFCISDSQNWESLPLSSLFSSTNNAVSIGDRQILLLPTCCGRLSSSSFHYICSYQLLLHTN